jgi:hypothetical protein
MFTHFVANCIITIEKGGMIAQRFSTIGFKNCGDWGPSQFTTRCDDGFQINFQFIFIIPLKV